MAVADIPTEQIVNVRSSWDQFLWELPGSGLYRWDKNIGYMYAYGAVPVPGQGLPPGPPIPNPNAPFSLGELDYLNSIYVRTINGFSPDAGGNVSITATPSAPTGGWTAGDLTTAVRASLGLADTASQPGHTHTAAQISDATSTGQTLMTSADAAAARVAIGAADSTRAFTAGAGLTGGGDLSADRSIALSAASIASLAKADTAVQASAVANSTIFAKSGTGVVYGIGFGTSGTASNAIPQRDANGQLLVPALPTAATQATSKQYADALGDTAGTVASTIGATLTIIGSAGTQRLTLSGNITVSLPGTAPASTTAFTRRLVLVQDATGSRTMTWPAGITWDHGAPPVLGTAAGATDIVDLIWDGTGWNGTALSGAVPATTATAGQAFIKNASGVVSGLAYAAATTANTLAQRNTTGGLTVPTTPTNTTDAVSKSYADAQDATRALSTRAFTAGAGLTGGGDLSADRTLALSAASIASLAKADTAVQPAALTAYLKTVNGVGPDANGNVVVTVQGGGYIKPANGIPKTDMETAVQTSLGKADTALQAAPVTSVAGKTGDVTLVASDVGAAATTHTHTASQISDSTTLGRSLLTAADAAAGRTALAAAPSATTITGAGSLTGGGDLTASRTIDLSTAAKASLAKADTALQSAPVTSVAGRTGAVTLAAADVTDATTIGRSVLTSADAAAVRTALALGNVSNTADADKPVSTLQAAADTATLNSAKAYADGKVADTGWVALTANTGWSLTSSAAYRVIGNVAYLRGQVQLTSGNITVAGTGFTTLPAGARPAQSFAGVVVGGGAIFAKLVLNTAGGIDYSAPSASTAYLRLDGITYTVN